MLKKNDFIFLLTGLLLLYSPIYSQTDSLNYAIKEIVVSDNQFNDQSSGYFIKQFSDSTIQRNSTSLTDLFRFNSNIYLKENGFGMVSSPSFRGTNASHTAIVWNGLTINSPLNGQIDFNTITPTNYKVKIRSGGGSVQYGSGAIGGSIHLDNQLKFKDQFINVVQLGYGSFNSKKLNLNQSYGTKKWTYNFHVANQQSDNDYKYLNSDERNKNGDFDRWNWNVNAGLVLKETQTLQLYHQSSVGDKNFSGTVVAPSRSKYLDNQYNTQIIYQIQHNNATSAFRVADLYEEFKYFENKDNEQFSSGRVNTILGKYNYNIQLTENSELQSFAQFQNLKGQGSDLNSPERNETTLMTSYLHQFTDQTKIGISARKDFINNFETPMVFSANGMHQLSEQVKLKLNASKNMKIPSFNDLYWNPGGNLDLKSEKSYQIDFGSEVKLKALQVEIHAYSIQTKDMIRWLPNEQNIFSPKNEDKVRIYGTELNGSWKKAIQENELFIDFNYDFTSSKDVETNKQLIYVPKNKANATASYKTKRASFYIQQNYTGSVRIIGGKLKDYTVANAGIEFHQPLKKIGELGLGFRLNNIYNTYYENVSLRPMPNRNVQTQLSIKF